MPASNTPLENELAKRRRYLLARAAQETPQQRLERFAALQQAAFAQLRASKHGYEHFLKRNFSLRRAEVVDGEWRPVSIARRTPSA